VTGDLIFPHRALDQPDLIWPLVTRGSFALRSFREYAAITAWLLAAFRWAAGGIGPGSGVSAWAPRVRGCKKSRADALRCRARPPCPKTEGLPSGRARSQRFPRLRRASCALLPLSLVSIGWKSSRAPARNNMLTMPTVTSQPREPWSEVSLQAPHEFALIKHIILRFPMRMMRNRSQGVSEKTGQERSFCKASEKASCWGRPSCPI
jgi:hypothetical protein